jgi:Tfp pilus assembly protein PilX
VYINNENGAFTIIATFMILVLLTILGTIAIRTSNTELQIAPNELIY